MNYRVMRQDDNGNIAEVDPLCASYKEAKQLKERMERGHHKQMYWIIPLMQDIKHDGVDPPL